MSAFEELGVMPELIQSLASMDWHLPTPVQTEAIPLILGGGDVAVAAETGSGKTGAFCLPLLQIVYETRTTNLSHTSSAARADSYLPLRLSAVDRGRQVAVSDDGVITQCRHPSIWQGVRATRGVASGKWYYVARPQDDGICRVGWSSAYAALNLGTDSRGFGYGATGMKSHAGKFDAYGCKYGKGDDVCCMVEFIGASGGDVVGAKVVVSYLRNEAELGEAFVVGWGQLGAQNLCLRPAVAMKNAQVEVDFNRRCHRAEEMGFRRLAEASVEDGEVSESVRNSLEELNMQDDDGGMNQKEGIGLKGNDPVALILEPSRELAGQVEEELTKMDKNLPDKAVRHVLLTGGGNPKKDRGIFHHRVDMVTGTLGSIVAHVKKGTFSMESVRFFVLDEADTFATDNLADILFLHEKVPTRNRVQTLLFSATLHSPEIKGLSEKIQSFPTWVDLKGKEAVPETLHHTLVRLDADSDAAILAEAPRWIDWPLDEVHETKRKSGKKGKRPRSGQAEDLDADMEDAADVRSLTVKKLKLIALKKAIDANYMHQAMIFVRTKLDADNVESFLLQCSGVPKVEVHMRRFRGRRDSGPELEYSCSVLHGGRRQEERNQALAAFKASEVRFLICTDVAARGIDVVGLPFLVNVTLPDKSENYIHRVGRVGRAERLGLAVSLVSTQKEAVWFHTCKNAKNGVCSNRKLVDAGGCVLWYNEPKLLAEIEKRLKGQIEELGADFRRKTSERQVYGARAGEEDLNAESAKRVEKLQPAVRKLVRMEEEVQTLFFSLQQAYS
eukprot:GFKZ01007350.1.p1 GENE.GFKZ01007350.1~~GFKZ01007350.1.p1  ORF type:complete len:796 (+),score=104.74 GFKZ01007350.1:34-2388(+)